jgi:hypothetical protein
MNAATTPWYAPAAHLYLLASTDLNLAWEYLRRSADYRVSWMSFRKGEQGTARRWGLRFLRRPKHRFT